MRKLLIGCALGVLVVAVSACGGSSGTPASEEALQRQADVYEISQIEKTFHESMSKKDIDEMMSLWTENATFTYGPGQTATGTEQIRKTWLGSTIIPARDALDFGSPGLQAPGNGQRRQGHAALRVPLHRRRHGKGGGGHGRRLRRREDRRSLADHQDGGKYRRAGRLSAGRKATCRRREQQGRRGGGC